MYAKCGPRHFAAQLQPYFDGQPLYSCFEIDTEAGWARVYVRDLVSGKPVLNKQGRPLIATVRGRLELRRIDPTSIEPPG
jgi:hypothetical protein